MCRTDIQTRNEGWDVRHVGMKHHMQRDMRHVGVTSFIGDSLPQQEVKTPMGMMMNSEGVSGKQSVRPSHLADSVSINTADFTEFEKRPEVTSSEVDGEEVRKARCDLKIMAGKMLAEPEEIGIAAEGSAIDHDEQSCGVQNQGKAVPKGITLRPLNDGARKDLQKLSSLLNSPYEDANKRRDQELEICRNRIKSIALAYDLLSESAELDRIAMADYISRLVDMITRSNRICPHQVSFRLKLDDTTLRPESIVSCGLIINEIVSNLLKYAFSDGRTGEICIEFRSLGASIYRLSISDNGKEIGLDDKSTPLRQALNSLIRDLKGQIRINNNNGNKAEVYFNELIYDGRFK